MTQERRHTGTVIEAPASFGEQLFTLLANACKPKGANDILPHNWRTWSDEQLEALIPKGSHAGNRTDIQNAIYWELKSRDLSCGDDEYECDGDDE